MRREKTVCVCESSTHDICVLPLRICKVKCDWFTRADVTEILLVARVRRRYFSAETSDSQKYVCVRRLVKCKRFDIDECSRAFDKLFVLISQ